MIGLTVEKTSYSSSPQKVPQKRRQPGDAPANLTGLFSWASSPTSISTPVVNTIDSTFWSVSLLKHNVPHNLPLPRTGHDVGRGVGGKEGWQGIFKAGDSECLGTGERLIQMEGAVAGWKRPASSSGRPWRKTKSHVSCLTLRGCLQNAANVSAPGSQLQTSGYFSFLHR